MKELVETMKRTEDAVISSLEKPSIELVTEIQGTGSGIEVQESNQCNPNCMPVTCRPRCGPPPGS